MTSLLGRALGRNADEPIAEPVPLDADDWRALAELVAAERERVGDENPDSELAVLERRVLSHVPDGPREETFAERWTRLLAEQPDRGPIGTGMEITRSVAAEESRASDERKRRDRELGVVWPEYR